MSRLAEEVVKESQRAEKAETFVIGKTQLEGKYEDLKARYTAAVELLGERTEQLEELKADLQDMKDLYKEQISFLAEQLSQNQEKK